MNQPSNPYGAPGTGAPDAIQHWPSTGLWLRRAGQLVSARLPLAAGITLMTVLLFAGGLNSCIGVFVLPHLMAGWAAAAFGLAGSTPSFESLFKAFQSFGRVFVAGLIYFSLVLLAAVVAAAFVLLVFFLIGFWSTALNQPSLMKMIDDAPSEELGLGIVIGFQVLWILMLGYPLARSQLVFILVVHRGMEAPDAFRESWRLTSSFGLRLTLIRACAHLAATVGLALCVIPGLLILPYCLALRGVIARSSLCEDEINAPASAQPDVLSSPG